MRTKMRKYVPSIAWLCTLAYFTSYLLRMNFNVMLVKIGTDLGVANTALAVVVTGLTIFYGGGQVVSGVLGDRISPRTMITVGLSVATLCNVAIYFCHSIPTMTVVWCINGFAHSMLWSPVVKLFSIYLTDSEYGYAMMRLMWGSSFAIVFLRLFCPALLGLNISWRVIMLILAGIGLAVTLTFALYSRKIFVEPVAFTGAQTGTAQKEKTVPLPRMVWLPTALILVAIVAHGKLKDGVDNWLPTYLYETFGIPEENAIFSTVILAVLGMLSCSLFDFIHRRFFRNEVFCSAVIFGVTAAAAAILFVVNSFVSSMVLSLALMTIITACMKGVNLILVATAPKRYVKSGKISTFTGVLDAAAYAGSALATYGFAAFAEGFGWNMTVLLWAIIGVAGLVLCLVATPLWARFRREYSDNPEV
ncbi:MAG: MFS transporter [Clostridia bacterium]|nr:MFS transporter [Clostridia bacterium]